MYLDNAATTKPNKEILDTIKPYITDMWHNPSAIYSDAIKVREDIESVRCKIANYINCNSDEIYFTSGGSEANNWVIQGFIRKCRKDNVKPIIITSNIEHKSILRCLENIKVEDRMVKDYSLEYDEFIYIENSVFDNSIYVVWVLGNPSG